jgi:hypothetical protein
LISERDRSIQLEIAKNTVEILASLKDQSSKQSGILKSIRERNNSMDVQIKNQSNILKSMEKVEKSLGKDSSKLTAISVVTVTLLPGTFVAVKHHHSNESYTG